MLAAILSSPRSIRVCETQSPSMESVDALVRVRATALCGTDVNIYDGHYDVRYPLIMGHEATGYVEKVGPKVAKISPGERVAINPVFFCGHCRLCVEGKQNLCLNGGLLGRDKAGTMAEYVALPETLLTVLPGNIGFEEGSLIQLLSTVLHAFRKIEPVEGKIVTILGQGASGLLFTYLCKLYGAAEIITVSR